MDETLCMEHETLIYDYLDNELTPRERALFEEHLATCPSCQEELVSARALFASLERLQPVQEPDSFKEGVLAGLPRQASLPLGRWILAGQMVATMALLVLAYPLLASWYKRLGAWLAPGWLSSLLAHVAAGRQDVWAWLLSAHTDNACAAREWLVSTLTVSVDLAWPKGLGLAWPQAALLVLALAGLWWLGNRLLLATQTNHNGGTT